MPPRSRGSTARTHASARTFEVTQSGQFVDLDGEGSAGGKLRLADERLTRDVTCPTAAAATSISRSREKAPRPCFAGTIAGQSATVTFAEELPEAGKAPAQKRVGARRRSAG